MDDKFVGDDDGVWLPLPPYSLWIDTRWAPFAGHVLAGIEAHRLEKGDWRNWSRNHLVFRLLEEVGELVRALLMADVAGVLREAEHVAALAMMVWDVQRTPE